MEISANQKEVISLDCESRDSALSSISKIYDLPKQDIEDFLHNTDLDHHYATTQAGDPPDLVFASLFEQHFEKSQRYIDCVYWFHITRVRRGTKFDEGILPLDKALDFIWNTFLEIFRGTKHEENLKSMRINGVHNSLYNQKVGAPLHAGPYGMLVRDTVFRHQEMVTHDYLQMPEIMQDICRGYKAEYGVTIESEVRDELEPCIVKFWAEPPSIRNCVTTSLYYLYLTGNSEELNGFANTNYDGYSQPVTKGQIVNVEYL